MPLFLFAPIGFHSYFTCWTPKPLLASSSLLVAFSGKNAHEKEDSDPTRISDAFFPCLKFVSIPTDGGGDRR